MNPSAATVPAVSASRLFRRLVLGTAFFLGLALALVPRSPTVHAQEPKSPPVAAPAAPGITSVCPTWMRFALAMWFAYAMTATVTW